MHRLVLVVALSAAACSGSPGALGITGPGAAPAPAPVPENIAPAGVPDTGNSFGPSFGPMPSGNGRYFNYN
jgi:hypothetical protein